VIYFDDFGSHTFNTLNLSRRNARPQTLMRVGSITPYAIAVDADFIYLSTQHPRYAGNTCDHSVYTFITYTLRYKHTKWFLYIKGRVITKII